MVVEKVFHSNEKILEWKWSTNNKLMEKPFWTSAYLVDQTLFDCCAPGSMEEMDDFLQNLPQDSRPTQCFLTHAHEDHAGTGKLLVEKYKIPLYSPPQSIDLLKQGWSYQEYRKMTWGETGLLKFEAQPYPAHISTPSGYKFEKLSLPGHSPDLHAFIERTQGWAFVGDMMLPQYQMLFGQTCEIQEDIKVIAKSLEKLYLFTKGMTNLLIFVSGKGAYAGREIIRTRINEIDQLHRQVHEISIKLGNEMKPTKKIKKIVSELYGGESFFGGITNGELSRANMVVSCLKWALNE
jgi:glyoxylase-like metal-dependent hydrolase (beta-lactamase superfamily II)